MIKVGIKVVRWRKGEKSGLSVLEVNGSGEGQLMRGVSEWSSEALPLGQLDSLVHVGLTAFVNGSGDALL